VSAVAPRAPADATPPLDGARRLESRLWLAQRISAIVVAVCVIVHLVTIVIVVKSGLSAEIVLGRLRGSTAWLAFYAIFVIAVAIHAPIGLRAIAAEWLDWRGRFLNAATFFTGALLLALGLRAVAGLFFGAAS
jgi:fumarate reductase subunit C